MANTFRSILFRAGFDLLEERDIEPSRLLPMAITRAGSPITALLFGDLFLMAPTTGSTRYDNARLGTVKDISNWLDKTPSISGHAWWSSTTGEAIEYSTKIYGAKIVREALARLDHMRTEMESPFPVCHVYDGYMTRARVYRVRHNRREYICKVFKKGRERFLGNETEVLGLSGHLDHGLVEMFCGMVEVCGM